MIVYWKEGSVNMSFEMCRREIIYSIYKKFSQYLVPDGHDLQMIDPFEKKVIGFHYGESHFAVSWIIFGTIYKDTQIFTAGVKLLKGFISHISEYQKEKEYHWDFNNIAFCTLIEFLEKNPSVSIGISVEELKDLVVKQSDSVHGTINWMPMRAYTNYCKYVWTKDDAYRKKAESYLENVDKAAYSDGFFEDFLPKGKSFNFQYHVYTTAMLDFLSRRYENVKKPDLAIECCEKMLDCEGDINYLGRGNNQIFAWGPALYVFYENKKEPALLKSTEYFNNRINRSIEKMNLIMSDLPGEDRNWWWDYHYASVYFAHLSYWLTLTYIDVPEVNAVATDTIHCSDSGVHFYNGANEFVCVFDGRKHYLAEKGPIVANIGFKDLGTVFKGPLGPCGGQFGNKYSNHLSTIINYFGPIEKISVFGYCALKNIFPKSISIHMNDSKICIDYDLGKCYKNVFFSIPIHCDKSDIDLKVLFDGKNMDAKSVGCYVGPYGRTERYETRIAESRQIQIEISRRL